MLFYLLPVSPSATSVDLQFPVNPEEVAVQADGQAQTFSVLELGEISLPRGRKATRYSWSGFLPGAGRAGQPFMAFWRPPLDLLWQLETWPGQKPATARTSPRLEGRRRSGHYRRATAACFLFMGALLSFTPAPNPLPMAPQPSGLADASLQRTCSGRLRLWRHGRRRSPVPARPPKLKPK